MALAALLSIPPFYAAALGVLLVVLYHVVRSKQYHLDHIPGPFLAQYTDAWRAYKAWRFNHFKDGVNYQTELLGKYGDVVRIGPNTVLVLDPEAINSVLGFKERLEKGPGYKVFVLGGEYLSFTSFIYCGAENLRRDNADRACRHQGRSNTRQISKTNRERLLALFSERI